MIAIETSALSVRHPLAESDALQSIDLQLEEGKVYGLIGHNGAGKTTLCSTVRGLIPSLLGGTVTGDVLVFGTSIKELEPAELAGTIGLVFENPYTQLTGSKATVVEEIAFGLENLGWERERIIARTADVIEAMGLAELAFRDPLQLSGGQRQRVSLAAVLAMDTPVIVIDEPTSQLDPSTTREIIAAIQAMKDHGKTVLLAENKLDELIAVADELIILDHGQLMCKAAPVEALTFAANSRLGCGYPEIFRLARKLRSENDWLTVEDALRDLSELPAPKDGDSQ